MKKGRSRNKQELLADLSPFPPGISGSIRIAKVQSHIERNVAILSYDLDETETIYGQKLHARYHATDTWLQHKGEWQIAAGQVLRYYEDPAAGKADRTRYGEYAGTYELAPGVTVEISVEGNELTYRRGQGLKQILYPEAPDLFFRTGVEGRVLFDRNEKGKVVAMIDRRNNEEVAWRRTNSSWGRPG
jgi:hypothetical protein